MTNTALARRGRAVVALGMVLPNLSGLSVLGPAAATGAAAVVGSLKFMQDKGTWVPGMFYDEIPEDLSEDVPDLDERLEFADLYVKPEQRAALLLLTASKVRRTDDTMGTKLAPHFGERAKNLAYAILSGIRDDETTSAYTLTADLVATMAGGAMYLEKLPPQSTLYLFFVEELPYGVDAVGVDANAYKYIYFGAYKMIEHGSQRVFVLDTAKNGYNLASRVGRGSDSAVANKKLVDLATRLGVTEVQNSMFSRMDDLP